MQAQSKWNIARRAVVALCLCVAGCASPAIDCGPGPAPRPVAWIVDYGWHTEILVPVQQIEGPLGLFRSMFPGAPVLSFGFGKQSFFTLDDPGSGDLLAGAVPGPGAIRVIPLRSEPVQGGQGALLRVALTPAEWARLSGFLWRSLQLGPDGTPVPVATPNATTGRFFAATQGYSLAYTCNTWTVDGLQQAGLSMGWQVSRSSSAMREVATLRTACAPGPD